MVEIPVANTVGHDITAKKIHNGWMISYIYTYKDALHGSQRECVWQFGVSEEGQYVEFMGRYGDLPQELFVNNMLVMEEN